MKQDLKPLQQRLLEAGWHDKIRRASLIGDDWVCRNADHYSPRHWDVECSYKIDSNGNITAGDEDWQQGDDWADTMLEFLISEDHRRNYDKAICLFKYTESDLEDASIEARQVALSCAIGHYRVRNNPAPWGNLKPHEVATADSIYHLLEKCGPVEVGADDWDVYRDTTSQSYEGAFTYIPMFDAAFLTYVATHPDHGAHVAAQIFHILNPKP
jgi:hypothetical protein